MAIKLSIRSFTKNGLEILSKKLKKNPTLIYWSAVRLSTYFQYHVITINMFHSVSNHVARQSFLMRHLKGFMSSVKTFKDSHWFLALGLTPKRSLVSNSFFGFLSFLAHVKFIYSEKANKKRRIVQILFEIT